MKLRWYQQEAIDNLYAYLVSTKGHPIVALPTGTGKSYVIAEFVHLMMQHFKGLRILKLTHVKELIQQNYDELKKVWPAAPAGIYSASVGIKEHHFPITYAGIGTIHKKAQLFGHIDFVLIDESHLVSDKEQTMYRRFLYKLLTINPNLRIIGLTATPWRLGVGHLTSAGIFTDVCYDMTSYHNFNRLIAEGFMVPLVPKRTQLQFDISTVRVTAGEYNEKDVQEVMDVDELTLQAAREIIREAKDRNKVLVFSSGIQHAEHVADTLSMLDKSHEASFVHSKISGEERDARITAFKQRKIKYMVNNNILTTGFNDPEIDMIVILFVTLSPNKWVQALGRGTRPCPAVGKIDCKVLDFGNNTQRLGPINDPVEPRRKGKKPGEAPVKICPHCDTYNHASVRHCVMCGYEFPKEYKFKPVSSETELLKGDKPVVSDMEVERITYSKHSKIGKPPSLQVTYFCGLSGMYKEWVCLEHTTGIRNAAARWWRQRWTEKDALIPDNIDSALQHINKLKEPKRIKVWMNAPYPEIISHEF